MRGTTTITVQPTVKIAYITVALILLTGAIYFYVASQDYTDISQSAHQPADNKDAQDIMATTNEMIFFIIIGLGYTAVGIYIVENRYRNKIPYIMTIIGSLALIIFYILTRTINIPTIGIQDDIGITDIFTKVMQGSNCSTVFIHPCITKKEKIVPAIPVLEYEAKDNY